MLLAAVFGGAIRGLGVGLLFLRGISTGGTDLAALLLRRVFPNVPSGTLLLLIDAAVVAFAVCVFRDLEVALYSTITIWVSSKVIDALAQGVDYAKVIYTVTDRGEEVTELLNTHTDRGTTVIPALGGYTGGGEADGLHRHAAARPGADPAPDQAGRSTGLHLCHRLHRGPRRGLQSGLISLPI